MQFWADRMRDVEQASVETLLDELNEFIKHVCFFFFRKKFQKMKKIAIQIALQTSKLKSVLSIRTMFGRWNIYRSQRTTDHSHSTLFTVCIGFQSRFTGSKSHSLVFVKFKSKSYSKPMEYSTPSECSTQPDHVWKIASDAFGSPLYSMLSII